MARKIINESGNKYGRWTVLNVFRREGAGRVRWLCRCECGVEKSLIVSEIKRGRSQSCGCLSKGRPPEYYREHCTTHGNTGTGWRTPEYASWNGLTQRCLNPKNPRYPSYGGRGITVCREWVDSFEAFLRDMGPRPSLDHSIDRFPNNNGNYEPGNCRWATRSQQQLNRRNNHRLAFNGESLTIVEWARKMGVPKERIASRLRYGWSTEKTLSAPSQFKAKAG